MSLRTLDAAIERFDDELARALENIHDVNTDYKQPRVIVLKVALKPNEDRSLLDIQVVATSKLTPARVVRLFARTGVGGDGPVAYVDTSQQMPLFPPDDPKVVDIARAQESGGGQ